jgi:hypothetical protein
MRNACLKFQRKRSAFVLDACTHPRIVSLLYFISSKLSFACTIIQRSFASYSRKMSTSWPLGQNSHRCRRL